MLLKKIKIRSNFRSPNSEKQSQMVGPPGFKAIQLPKPAKNRKKEALAMTRAS
jgi:hypothetical protein